MATRFMLDANICIYIRQKRPAEVLARFEKLDAGEAGLSVITYGELLYGAAKSGDRQQALERLESLTAFLPVLDMPAHTSQEYGRIRATLEARGETIGGNDLWIAAHARALDIVLVTSNEREFKRVPGLKVQNWAK